MIAPQTFSRWIAAASIAALQLAAVDLASGQNAPESSPRRLVRRPHVVTKAAEALVRAGTAIEAQNFELAYAEYRAALKLAAGTGPEHDEALRGFSESGVKLAQQRLKERRAAEAERIAREVLAVNANYRPALELLAKVKPPAKTDGPLIEPRSPTITRVLPNAIAPPTEKKPEPQPTPPPDEEPPTVAEQPPAKETPPATTAPEK